MSWMQEVINQAKKDRAIREAKAKRETKIVGTLSLLFLIGTFIFIFSL